MTGTKVNSSGHGHREDTARDSRSKSDSDLLHRKIVGSLKDRRDGDEELEGDGEDEAHVQT